MTEQVTILRELQAIMARARALDEEKRKIPLEVADLKALFEEREAQFLAVQQEFDAVKKERRDKEREIEEEREKVEKAKAKLMSIKTNKEYYAMLKEIEQTKRGSTTREDELLAIMTRYDEIEKRMNDLSGEVADLGGRYRERMVDIEARMAAFDGDIEKIQAEKAGVAAKLEPGTVRRFELIFDRRDGIAIVAARNQSCTGCHMNLSPQLFNLLQRGDKLYTCPNCNRYVYYEEEAPQAAAAE